VRRRQVLALLGGVPVLAGCSGRDGGSPTSSPTRTPPLTEPATATVTESATPTATRTTDLDPEPVDKTVTSLSGGPFDELRTDVFAESFPLSFGIEWLSQATATDPAELAITVANTSSEDWTIQTGTYGLPMPSTLGESATTSQLVVGGHGQTSDECPTAEQTERPLEDRETLSPSQTISERYSIFNHIENESCWPGGDYRFSETYTLQPGGEPVAFEWGFDLRIA
jgi:hypothetical protein